MMQDPPVVLIVDDNVNTIEVLSTVLETIGLSVRMVTDGFSALQIAAFSPPDLILLDMYMPGLNGFEVCQQLKQQQRTRDIPVLFISAQADPEDIIRGFAVGAVDYISKPFQQEEVLARVKVHLQLRSIHQQLSEQNSRLELELQERYCIEEALKQAKEEAEVANQVKSFFLSKMSHELRTPLHAILGFTEILLLDSEYFQPEQKDFLETMHQSGEHLLLLINNIFEMSKIEARYQSLELQPLQIKPFLAQIIKQVQMKARKKSLSLELIIDPELPTTLQVDKQKLSQILLNLLINAIKFTKRGYVRLRVFPILTDTNNKTIRACFQVEDTGCGLSEADLQNIFEPFAQTPLGEQKEGVGLGLSISHEFAHLMGGDIQVQSQVNRGTTFRVELPLTFILEQPLIPAVREPQQSHLRILVAEDNLNNQKVLLQMLEKLGYSADLAKDGRNVLEMVQRQPYDLILMDIEMPEMTGLEATRQIRQKFNTPQPIIIALTAHSMTEDQEQGLAVGMNDYLSKPISLDQLGITLRGWQSQIEMAYKL